MNSPGVRKSECSSDGEDAVEGRTSVITGSVSDPLSWVTLEAQKTG